MFLAGPISMMDEILSVFADAALGVDVPQELPPGDSKGAFLQV
jgi:hypothetical protein